MCTITDTTLFLSADTLDMATPDFLTLVIDFS